MGIWCHEASKNPHRHTKTDAFTGTGTRASARAYTIQYNTSTSSASSSARFKGALNDVKKPLTATTNCRAPTGLPHSAMPTSPPLLGQGVCCNTAVGGLANTQAREARARVHAQRPRARISLSMKARPHRHQHESVAADICARPHALEDLVVALPATFIGSPQALS